MASITLGLDDLVDPETQIMNADRLVELLEGTSLRFDQVGPEDSLQLEFTGAEDDIYRLIGRISESDGDAEVTAARIIF